MLGEQVVALPDTAHPAWGNSVPLEPELLLDPKRAMAGMVEGMGQHRMFDLDGHAVGMRPLGTRQPVDEPFGSIGL